MRFFLSVLVLACSSTSFAECTRTEPPELPSGATSDLATMVEGQKAVKAYVADTEAYLACLTKDAEEAHEEMTEEMRSQGVDTYNAAVDEMEAVAAVVARDLDARLAEDARGRGAFRVR